MFNAASTPPQATRADNETKTQPPSKAKGSAQAGFEWTTKADYDLYVSDPTVEDLPVLYKEFQKGSEVWPWVWLWRNEYGPHHVFVGVNAAVRKRIEELASDRRNNILLVDPARQRGAYASDAFYHKCRCAIVENQVALMDPRNKILMLDDERVAAFDECTIVAPPPGEKERTNKS